MSVTRTGQFPIGFRLGWSDWQKDINNVIAWAQANDFEAIDCRRSVEDVEAVHAAGLRVGSTDLLEWQGMISADKAKRDDAIAQNREYVAACASHAGAVNHFLVMLPDNAELARSENFGYMVESFNELAPAFETHNAKLVIEGWPGPGALCCTPEGYRAFFKECPSPAYGVNYDPSHLLRMQIDPMRFLREFKDRVFHVHGKDTEIFVEHLYEYGNLQPATFAKNRGFGEMVWRYTIPGHGEMRWVDCFKILADNGYAGAVSIELEDDNFNGSEAGEKQGLNLGRAFLSSC